MRLTSVTARKITLILQRTSKSLTVSIRIRSIKKNNQNHQIKLATKTWAKGNLQMSPLSARTWAHAMTKFQWLVNPSSCFRLKRIHTFFMENLDNQSSFPKLQRWVPLRAKRQRKKARNKNKYRNSMSIQCQQKLKNLHNRAILNMCQNSSERCRSTRLLRVTHQLKWQRCQAILTSWQLKSFDLMCRPLALQPNRTRCSLWVTSSSPWWWVLSWPTSETKTSNKRLQRCPTITRWVSRVSPQQTCLSITIQRISASSQPLMTQANLSERPSDSLTDRQTDI